ncbi:MAG: hypothetical protein OXH23_16275 [bacterium]|nr:hypothetical protein [bacterium]
MNVVAITLIGVVGTGLISAFFVVIRMIFGLITNLSDQLGGLRTVVHDGFREHGERLARIEAKLDIDPPVEAA